MCLDSSSSSSSPSSPSALPPRPPCPFQPSYPSPSSRFDSHQAYSQGTRYTTLLIQFLSITNVSFQMPTVSSALGLGLPPHLSPLQSLQASLHAQQAWHAGKRRSRPTTEHSKKHKLDPAFSTHQKSQSTNLPTDQLKLPQPELAIPANPPTSRSPKGQGKAQKSPLAKSPSKSPTSKSPAAKSPGDAAEDAAETTDVSGDKERPTIDCPVCGDLAIAHFHYGGMCCYSCKAFFRRVVNTSKVSPQCHC